MDAGINNVIYMELRSGPKMANGTCEKTIVAGTIDRGSTVLIGYSARESAFMSRCLTGEIAVVAPHRDTIVLLRNQGHLSCQSPKPASG
jgi:hypothetical protein